MNKPITRATAAIGAIALGMLGAVALAAPASAALPANIDDARDGTSSITVHKHAQPNPAGNAGDGAEIPGGLPDPLDGVDFSLYQLTGIDLGTDAGWDTAAAISAALDGGAFVVPNGDPATQVTIGAATYPVGTATTQETGTDGPGATTFDALDFGIYLVVEGADNGDNNITNTAAPFIVSVPFATGDDTWLYDVHAYPKNSVTSVEKTITPQTGLGLGSVVEFPVTVAVPNLAPGEDFTGFVVSDTLDDRLGSVGVSSVTVDGVDVPAVNYEIVPNGQNIRVEFTDPEGLDWLAGQTGKSVVVTFHGTVTSIGDGDIENSATAYINDPNETNGVDSNEVNTNWGDVKILKTDSVEGTGLEGAEFQVYAAAEPYAADCSAAVATGDPLAVGTQTTFRSAADGSVLIAGLFVSDSQNAPIDAQTRCYVVSTLR